MLVGGSSRPVNKPPQLQDAYSSRVQRLQGSVVTSAETETNMKRLFAGLVLGTAAVALSGCYIDPGYSYVRQSTYQGDAYYGHGVRTYNDGYYAGPVYGGYYAAPVYGGYYPGGYVPGVSLSIGGVWYGGSAYRGGYGYRGRGYGYRSGYWQGERRATRSQHNYRDGGRDDRGYRNRGGDR